MITIVIFTAANCQRPSTPSSVSSQVQDSGLYILIQHTGIVSHKRPGWKEFSPLTFGSHLDREDLLMTTSNSNAIIFCSDLSLVEIPHDYYGGIPCPQNGIRIYRDKSLVVDPRRNSQTSKEFPYILEPRHTFILDGNPMFIWHSSDAHPYTVGLAGGEIDWEIETNNNYVIYPDTAPSLESGIPYRVIVTDSNNRSSEEEKNFDLSFSVLPTKEINEIQSSVEKIRTYESVIHAYSVQFLIAEIYTSYNLDINAINILKEIAKNRDDPIVYQRLGNLYTKIGLYAEALQPYRYAIIKYQSSHDLNEEAYSLIGLGVAQQGSGDDLSAKENFQTAYNKFLFIGNNEGMNYANDRLKIMGDN